TIALTAAGLAAVGRPSNKGSVADLAQLLGDIPSDRDIVVLAENDEHDGLWPGKDGAEHTARRLADALMRPVRIAYPPDGNKDARAALISPAADEAWPTRGAWVLANLRYDESPVEPAWDDLVRDLEAGEEFGPNEGDDDPHRLAREALAGWESTDGL